MRFVVFLPAVRRVLLDNKAFYNKVLLIADSAGLGLFAVIGVKIAMEAAVSKNLFMVVFVAINQRRGRRSNADLLAGGVPFILVKYICGCGFSRSAALRPDMDLIGSNLSMVTGACDCVYHPYAVAHYKWNLPKAQSTKTTSS